MDNHVTQLMEELEEEAVKETGATVVSLSALLLERFENG
jgi:hypothetical protein